MKTYYEDDSVDRFENKQECEFRGETCQQMKSICGVSFLVAHCSKFDKPCVARKNHQERFFDSQKETKKFSEFCQNVKCCEGCEFNPYTENTV